MVEAAIVLPLLFLCIFGILEVGLLMRTYSSTANGVRAGGRMASVAGNDASADQQILERMSTETAGIQQGTIDYIILWNSTGPGEDVPSACLNAANSATAVNTTSLGVTDGGSDALGACNIYVLPQNAGGAFARATGVNSADYFGCSGPSDPLAGQRLDCRWPPQHRETVISPRVLPTGSTEADRLSPDYLGVYMRVSHSAVSGLIGNDLTVTDSTINLLEPSNFGVAG